MANSSQNQPSPQDSPKKLGSDRLPFEPKKRKKKPTPPAPSVASPIAPKGSKSHPQKLPEPPKPPKDDRASVTLAQTRIPDIVSHRMIRRILVFSGIPTFMGISSFLISYLIITQGIMELPNVAVLLTSLGCFGLGVLGLSYGVLSASWEEAEPGTMLGLSEFRVNVQRFLGAWREFRQGKTN